MPWSEIIHRQYSATTHLPTRKRNPLVNRVGSRFVIQSCVKSAAVAFGIGLVHQHDWQPRRTRAREYECRLQGS